MRLATAPFRMLLDTALPPRCAACGSVTGEGQGGGLCTGCFARLRLIGPPWCAACHLPFAIDRGEGAWCAGCIADPPRHAGIRAAVAYGEVAAALAIKLKHGGRVGIAPLIGRLMARHVDEPAPLLVPVPLHRWRLWGRGFNQSALIARVIAARSGGHVALDALARTRRTPSLGGLGRRERARALRSAIVPGPGAPTVRGRRIWLVDDVYTTGATAGACVRALTRAGAGPVTILAFARVLHDGDD